MPQARKTFLVAVLLFSGIAAAMLFRKPDNAAENAPPPADNLVRRDPAPSGAPPSAPPAQGAVSRLTGTIELAEEPDAAPAAKSSPSETKPVALPADFPMTPLRDATSRPASFGPATTGQFPATKPASEPPASTTGDNLAAAPPAAPVKHKLVDGDTLSALANRYLGRSDRYLEIFAANRDVLTHPDVLPLGKEIKIPTGPPPAAAIGPAPPAGDSQETVPIAPGALRGRGA